jgi:hypothetical protein
MVLDALFIFLSYLITSLTVVFISLFEWLSQVIVTCTTSERNGEGHNIHHAKVNSHDIILKFLSSYQNLFRNVLDTMLQKFDSSFPPHLSFP